MGEPDGGIQMESGVRFDGFPCRSSTERRWLLGAGKDVIVKILGRLVGTPQQRSCRQVRRVLQSLLDGEFDDDGASQVSTHLDDCRRCGLGAIVIGAPVNGQVVRAARS
ncbi:MAG: zf-HC2 domain-containing protein [Acidimicrobiales bacterium]